MTWFDELLRRIEDSDDFMIAPFRPDGATPGTLIWVWAVGVDDAVFVRSANPGSRWFAAAVAQGAGVVETDGVRHQVRFEHLDEPALRDRVDAAFARKYAADPYFSPEVLRRSRERILRIMPANTDRREDPA